MATAKADTRKAGGAVTTSGNGAGKVGPIDLTGRVNVTELRKPLLASVGAGDLAVEKLREAPTAYSRAVKDLRGSVRDIPQQVRRSINGLQGKATTLYGDLAQRGERLVTSMRRVPPTQAAGEQARAAIAGAKAVGATARRSVRSVAKPGQQTSTA